MTNFKVTEANVGDIEELIEVSKSSMQDDWLYWRMLRNVSAQEVRELNRSALMAQFDLSHRKVFKVTDMDTQ